MATVTGCSRAANDSASTHAASVTSNSDWFVDRAKETGLDFVHVNGATGSLYDPEVIGAGVALVDYDNDGDLDIFLVQGSSLGTQSTTERPAPESSPPRARLFRNDLEIHPDGTRTLHFTDVTEASGINARGYGMGVAAGDFNNDGCIDLYVTTFGQNQLWRNNCDGTFSDVTRQSGTADAGWSVAATFFDYDRDGWLDLFVGHYLNYSTDHHTGCFSIAGLPDYCSPLVRTPQANRLFHNNRDGTFTDVTARAGLARDFNGTLGVVAADFNRDGWPDLYVANDSRPNQLWINQRNGTFKNMAVLAGAAVSADGTAKASMGVDAADFDNDGDDDLIITALTGQGSNLFVNTGNGDFEEASPRTGLHAPTLPLTGFGAGWFDFDNDGWLDTMSANGLVLHAPEHPKGFDALAQHLQLLRNVQGRFENVTDRAGTAFQVPRVGRGVAFGDIDNDGDTDLVVANANGPVQLLINQVGSRNHWLGLRLIGIGGRDMVGTRVEILRGDGLRLWRRAHADGSYASSSDPRVLVGLGPSSAQPRIRVEWPDGKNSPWMEPPIDRYTTLRE